MMAERDSLFGLTPDILTRFESEIRALKGTTPTEGSFNIYQGLAKETLRREGERRRAPLTRIPALGRYLGDSYGGAELTGDLSIFAEKRHIYKTMLGVGLAETPFAAVLRKFNLPPGEAGYLHLSRLAHDVATHCQDHPLFELLVLSTQYLDTERPLVYEPRVNTSPLWEEGTLEKMYGLHLPISKGLFSNRAIEDRLPHYLNPMDGIAGLDASLFRADPVRDMVLNQLPAGLRSHFALFAARTGYSARIPPLLRMSGKFNTDLGPVVGGRKNLWLEKVDEAAFTFFTEMAFRLMDGLGYNLSHFITPLEYLNTVKEEIKAKGLSTDDQQLLLRTAYETLINDTMVGAALRQVEKIATASYVLSEHTELLRKGGYPSTRPEFSPDYQGIDIKDGVASKVTIDFTSHRLVAPAEIYKLLRFDITHIERPSQPQLKGCLPRFLYAWRRPSESENLAEQAQVKDVRNQIDIIRKNILALLPEAQQHLEKTPLAPLPQAMRTSLRELAIQLRQALYMGDTSYFPRHLFDNCLQVAWLLDVMSKDEIIKNDLHAEPGQPVVVCGRSGAGHSSLAHLLIEANDTHLLLPASEATLPFGVSLSVLSDQEANQTMPAAGISRGTRDITEMIGVMNKVGINVGDGALPSTGFMDRMALVGAWIAAEARKSNLHLQTDLPISFYTQLKPLFDAANIPFNWKVMKDHHLLDTLPENWDIGTTAFKQYAMYLPFELASLWADKLGITVDRSECRPEGRAYVPPEIQNTVLEQIGWVERGKEGPELGGIAAVMLGANSTNLGEILGQPRHQIARQGLENHSYKDTEDFVDTVSHTILDPHWQYNQYLDEWFIAAERSSALWQECKLIFHHILSSTVRVPSGFISTLDKNLRRLHKVFPEYNWQEVTNALNLLRTQRESKVNPLLYHMTVLESIFVASHNREIMQRLKPVDVQASNGAGFEVKNMKNVRLSSEIGNEHVVANDFSAETGIPTFFLSPNFSGKSITLEAIAGVLSQRIFGWMLADQAAMPYDYSVLPLLKKGVQSKIYGEYQYSTEAEIIGRVNMIYDYINQLREGEVGIVLTDELLDGLDPADSSPLIQSLLEYAEKKGVIIIFAGHQHEMVGQLQRSGQVMQQDFKVLHVVKHSDDPAERYKLHEGHEGSEAIDTALDCGLNPEIAAIAQILFKYQEALQVGEIDESTFHIFVQELHSAYNNLGGTRSY